jgi:hypothetical protein
VIASGHQIVDADIRGASRQAGGYSGRDGLR